MAEWPQNPIIYEINTWVWLSELSRRHGDRITLASVPEREWDALGVMNLDGVWLMGVWERSPLGTRIANENEGMVEEFRSVLPDFEEADNVGSPYCVRRYVVDDHLGGPDGLAVARHALAARGIRLILDYVPNHVALDHPALQEHPEFFIHGDRDDLEREPQAFFEVDGKVIARGRDPNFPAWPDVAQLNAFSPGLRRAVIETVSSIAAQCDGMRCDMAMLMMTDVFRRTWGDRAGDAPQTEFWPEIIAGVKQGYPGTLFMAEAYWDLEYALMEQGFDYCYDKRLYDRLVHEDAESVRGHLHADIDYQRRLVRFIENHDEPRVATTLEPPEREKAAAVVSTTLPGARLLHQGQFEGRRTRIPVFLGRGPLEPEVEDLTQFYEGLLQWVRACGGLRGQWSLCEVNGWPDNESCRNLLAWGWQDGETRSLVVVNYSGTPSQGMVVMPWHDLSRAGWTLEDRVADAVFEREGGDMLDHGLYVELAPWGTHFLQLNPASQQAHQTQAGQPQEPEAFAA
jgi:alpha amylase-like protein